MLSTIDTEAANATARIKSLSSRLESVALGIRRRATEAINKYRLCRLASLRADLETRLVRKAKDSRLREALQDRALQLRQQHHLVVFRLQEYIQARKLLQQQETEALRQQHHLVVARLQEFIQARKLQRQQETEALRQQHQVVVSRLKEIRSRLKKEEKPQRKPAFDTSASFPLQECHQVQPPPVAGPLTTQIGPLCLSPTEATSIRAIQDTPVDNSTPRVLYSDGSLLNSGTPDVSLAFGVVDLTQDNPLTVQGRTDGHASSAKSELMGLLAAVLSAPPEHDHSLLSLRGSFVHWSFLAC